MEAPDGASFRSGTRHARLYAFHPRSLHSRALFSVFYGKLRNRGLHESTAVGRTGDPFHVRRGLGCAGEWGPNYHDIVGSVSSVADKPFSWFHHAAVSCVHTFHQRVPSLVTTVAATERIVGDTRISLPGIGFRPTGEPSWILPSRTRPSSTFWSSSDVR